MMRVPPDKTPRVPRTIKGKRPSFHEQSAIDRLIAMNLTLVSEISVLRDRLDTMERLAVAHGWLGEHAIESFAPTLDVIKAREATREGLVERVFHIMREEIEGLERDETSEGYWSTVREIEGEAEA
jgi:hypothetical protein